MNAVAVVLAATATWLATAPAREPRLRRLLRSTSPARRDARVNAPRIAGALAGVACLVLVGGVIGVAAAVGCVVLAPRLFGRLESRAARSRRELLERQAPIVAELLAATLASGAPMRGALAAVADAVGAPMAGAIRPVVAAMELGADPASAWQALPDDAGLKVVADAVVRSERSGAPLAAQLSRIADDLRRARQVAIESAARSAGVSAVGPLAACFLPAFLLLGVVPVVAGLASGLAG